MTPSRSAPPLPQSLVPEGRAESTDDPPRLATTSMAARYAQPISIGPVYRQPTYRFQSLRHGCYFLQWRPKDTWWYRFNGTMRVERHGAGTTASGDLYHHNAYIIQRWPSYRFVSNPDPSPSAGIPIFPRSGYRYYLRVTGIRQDAARPQGPGTPLHGPMEPPDDLTVRQPPGHLLQEFVLRLVGVVRHGGLVEEVADAGAGPPGAPGGMLHPAGPSSAQGHLGQCRRSQRGAVVPGRRRHEQLTEGPVPADPRVGDTVQRHPSGVAEPFAPGFLVEPAHPGEHQLLQQALGTARQIGVVPGGGLVRFPGIDPKEVHQRR